jgi:predicted kinase
MNRPQAIIIIGNIASGKTTLARRIQSHLPDFQYICLDDIRLEQVEANPDINSVVMERESQKKAFEKIDQNRFIVYESTGASQFYHKALNRIKDQYQCFTIKILSNPKQCIKRFHQRKEDGKIQIKPGWFKVNASIDSQIFRIHDLLVERDSDFSITTDKLNPEEISAAALMAYANFISKSQKISS